MKWIKNRLARIGAAMSLVVTVLAPMSFDQGKIALLLPPSYKVPVTIAALALFVIFQLIQKQKPKVIESEVMHIYHHYPKENNDREHKP